MRALAEFIMRGRAQAAVVAALGFLVPLLGPSTVALVSLRRGGIDGAYVMAWAILPYVALAFASPDTLPVAFYSLCILAAVVGGAIILRKENSWPHSVFGLVALSAVGGLIYGWTFTEFNEALASEAEAHLQTLSQGQSDADSRPAISATFIVGMVATLIAFQALLALVIGRWWQAMLYNPGGFRVEFYEFRLNRNAALLYFAAMALALGMGGANGSFWGFLAALPLVLVTTAIVHNRVRARGMSIGWLVLFYLLMAFQPFYLVAACVGLSDSWVNYRQRIGPQGPEGRSDE